MILVLLIWVIVFFVFFVFGFSVVKVLNLFTEQFIFTKTLSIDEFFFIGFLTQSSLVGLLSIFVPIGNAILYGVIILTLFLLLINIKEIHILLKETVGFATSYTKWELLLISFLTFFILSAVIQKITLGDTESYHAQSIQWIRRYAVVPGLGNIHGRLAFNSMFFVISGLFTFQIKDILIFPLNGICYLVLIVKLYTLYKKENNQGTKWKSVFYILTLLISLLFLIPNLNSPSPDVICSILIIYAFVLIFNLEGKRIQFNVVHVILLNLVVFSCISYKVSSLFLISTILFFLNKEVIKRGLITSSIFLLIISAFIIRNYYLSGFIIYPFPEIDIFNVDWKIPVNDVLSMKLEIESWAKISTIPASDVLKMNVVEWIIPWFNSLNFNNKFIVVINLFSIISLIIMFLKRDFFLVKIQIILLINLFFWFFSAPDPRFAYGFLFVGFSLTIAYIIKYFEFSRYSEILKYLKVGLACFLFLIICRRIKFPVDTIKNPSLWVISASFGTVETKDYYSDFHYRVPIPEGGCFNVEIPCVPYPLTNIVLREDNLQDGFKVAKQHP